MGKDDDERPNDGSRTRKQRSEVVDHAALTRALKEAFEAGASSARATVDAQASALEKAYAQIDRLHTSHEKATDKTQEAIDKSQKLVDELREVASQNIGLTLAKNAGRVDEIRVEQDGENKRHAMTLVGTSPYLAVVLEKVLPLVLPGASFTPPRPAGPGYTPREAAERFAAALRTGSEGSKIVLETLAAFCENELERPGDFQLLLDFLAATLSGSVETPEAAPAEAP